METEVIIRFATEVDLGVLVENNKAMALETENKVLPDHIIRPGVTRLLNDPSKGFYLVAQQNREVVGNLMITKEWSDWRNGDMWWFQSVYVSPAHRGKGVFTALFDHVVKMAREQDVKELRLYVEQENTVAQKVYAANGMKKSHYDMWEIAIG